MILWYYSCFLSNVYVRLHYFWFLLFGISTFSLFFPYTIIIIIIIITVLIIIIITIIIIIIIIVKIVLYFILL